MKDADERVEIFTPFVTVKGKKLFASAYGLKVFKILVPRSKLRTK